MHGTITRAIRYLLDELVGNPRCIRSCRPDPVIWRVYDRPLVYGAAAKLRMEVYLWADMQLDVYITSDREDLPTTLISQVCDPSCLDNLENLYRAHFPVDTK